MRFQYKRLFMGLWLVIWFLAGCTSEKSLPLTSKAFTTTNLQVTVEEPTLDPSYVDLCTSYWYRYDNNRGSKAFLTLNVTTVTSSTNHGTWRPAIEQAGMYRVEAYIPFHGTINWTCPSWSRTTSTDTTQARYTINHAYGASSVTLSQTPLQNEWLSLGDYYFKSGTDGSVSLTDLNAEASLSTSISFSAMRFTYVGPPPQATFLPSVSKGFTNGVSISQTWTTGDAGSPRTSFVPGETIRYYVTGTSSSASPVLISWTQTSPCGSTTLFAGNLTIGPGEWTAYTFASAPSCLGVYTFTVTTQYQDQTSSKSSVFFVGNPTSVTVTNRQAFDICKLPYPSQMQTWWNNSPYYVFGLYLGGIHRAQCSNIENLNASWINTVRQQGWWFIPTWVGPQAACSGFKNKIPLDTTQAYYQGRTEADLALAKAIDIGLGGSTIIYYDMEAFAPADTACRNSTKSFINGWVERLHERGAKAGAYGGPRSSYMEDWATIPNPPDDVWIAAWYPPPYSYNPNATVWTSALPNTLWSNHQRIRQYNGSHNETWGGVTFEIDSNASDGEVAVVTGSFQTLIETPVIPSLTGETLPANLQIDPPAIVVAAAATPSEESGKLRSAQMVSSGKGWVLKDDALLWTADSGMSWKDITPKGIEGEAILTAHFLDNRSGWLVTPSSKIGHLMAMKTTNGGKSWETSFVTALFDPITVSINSMQLDFADARNGWLAVQLQSGANFSQGYLFITTDGGQTWQPRTLPVGGRVSFIDAKTGWLLGGPGGDELYVTQDSGYTWQAVSPAGTHQDRNAAVLYSLPVFKDSKNGLLAVTLAGIQDTKVEIYHTSDGGLTWQLESIQPVKTDVPPGAPLQLAFNSKGDSFLALPGPARLLRLEEKGQAKSLVEPDGLPGGITWMDFSGNYGWAQVSQEICRGAKPSQDGEAPEGAGLVQCQQRLLLLQTNDSGATWTEITP